jgi:hypothetical protein
MNLVGRGVGDGGSVDVDFSDCAFYPTYSRDRAETTPIDKRHHRNGTEYPMADIQTIRENYRQLIAPQQKATSLPKGTEDRATCEHLFQAADQGEQQLREALGSPPLNPGPIYLVLADQLKLLLGGPDPDPPHVPHSFG